MLTPRGEPFSNSYAFTISKAENTDAWEEHCRVSMQAMKNNTKAWLASKNRTLETCTYVDRDTYRAVVQSRTESTRGTT